MPFIETVHTAGEKTVNLKPNDPDLKLIYNSSVTLEKSSFLRCKLETKNDIYFEKLCEDKK